MSKDKYAKVEATITYKVSVNDVFPLNLKEEKLQWKTVAGLDLDVVKPKVSVKEVK